MKAECDNDVYMVLYREEMDRMSKYIVNDGAPFLEEAIRVVHSHLLMYYKYAIMQGRECLTVEVVPDYRLHQSGTDATQR